MDKIPKNNDFQKIARSFRSLVSFQTKNNFYVLYQEVYNDFSYFQSLRQTTTEWQKQWQASMFDLENRLKSQLMTITESKTDMKTQVEDVKQRVDHFVQSLMKVTKLPGLVKDLQTRLQALEQE